MEMYWKPSEDIFNEIYRKNFWGDKESRSGPGSNLINTVSIRQDLSNIIKEFGITSILDIPCGDFYWMKEIDLGSVSYIGADIVDDIINHNIQNFFQENRRFVKLNIVDNDLPTVDLILCRDLFIHLSYLDIFEAIGKIKKCKSTYLLTTSYELADENHNIVTGGYSRPINLLLPPFSFPRPIRLISEDDQFKGKNLSLWKIIDL